MEPSVAHLQKQLDTKQQVLIRLKQNLSSSEPADRLHEVAVLEAEIRQLEKEKDELILAFDLETRRGPDSERAAPKTEPDTLFSPKSIVRALRVIHSPNALGEHPLAHIQAVSIRLKQKKQEESDFNRGIELIEILSKAIDCLRPEEDYDKSAPEWRYYTSIRLRYVDGLDRSEVAHIMNLSISHYDRFHKTALQYISNILKGIEQDARQSPENTTIAEEKPPSNLPRRPWLFVGRQPEIERLMEIVNPANRQWLAIVKGQGGVGKSTLAIEVAHLCKERQFFDAIVWADARMEFLRGLSREQMTPRITGLDQLFSTISETAGVSFSRQTDRDRRASVMKLLAHKRFLIIIDNFENLAHQQDLCRFVEREIPEPTKVIVTSRYDCLEGGRLIELMGLTLEDSKKLIRLQAQEQNIPSLLSANDEIVSSIWYATSGSPLALEWLIAQTKMLSLELDTLVEEIQTIKEDRDIELLEFCFGRSLSALDGVSKQVLEVFPYMSPISGVAVPTIRNILQTNTEAVQRSISVLRRLSLVQELLPGRFRTLDLTNHYLLAKQESTIQATNLDRVARYWLDFVGRSVSDFPKLKREYGNLKFILEKCFSEGLHECSIPLTISLGDFMFKNGHWSDMLTYGNLALSVAQEVGDQKSIAIIEVGHLGWILYHQREWEKCVAHSQSGMAAAREVGHTRALALGLRNLGIVYRQQGELQRARNYLEQAISEAKTLGDDSLNSIIEGSLIVTLTRLKEYERATELIESELDRAKKVADRERISIAIQRLGALAHAKGEFVRAERLLIESVVMDLEMGRRSSIAYTYRRLAQLCHETGRLELALEYSTKARSEFEEAGASKEILDEISQEINAFRSLSGEITANAVD
jgi:LuxR family glucitol operon transcriptional activator